MDELSINKNTPNDVVDQDSTQFFQPKEKDTTIEYFSERAKKLTTAVYLVTNLIPQTDPLRLSIRRFSIRLLSFVGLSSSKYSVGETSAEVRSLCKKVVEMLEIAFFSGYVSEMNFSVLKSEFDSFINEIAHDENFQATISPRSLKVAISGDKTLAPVLPATKGQKMVSVAAKPSVSSERKTHVSKNVVEAKKTSRKEAILSIIKRRGAVSIKDISAVILNCSEKTIQRELMALVDEGVLKKTGERRWSSYSLVV